MADHAVKPRVALICLLLALVTAAVYWPVIHCQFVNYDDDLYITHNARVQSGLSWDGIGWAMTAKAVGNWHPLTWVSYMLDCQWYGPNPAGYHVTSLLLHLANSLLLFLILRRMTGAQWRSAFVAALFALHPLHVESVAWISERKDVLSTFFGLLTIQAYTRYAQKRSKAGTSCVSSGGAAAQPYPGMGPTRRSALPDWLRRSATLPDRHGPTFDYWLAWLCFALGLMSKPMLVTLPFVLLLLDYWPLGRFRAVSNSQPSTFNSSAGRSKAETAQLSTPRQGEAMRRLLNFQLSTVGS